MNGREIANRMAKVQEPEADWADEMAVCLKSRSGFSICLFEDQRLAVAEALRSVERRTAEECIDIVTDSHTMGEWDGDCRRGIRERFKLKS